VLLNCLLLKLAAACDNGDHTTGVADFTIELPRTDIEPETQALQHLLADQENLAEVALPRHWMRNFFLAAHCLETQHNQEALSRLQVRARRVIEGFWVCGYQPGST